MKLRVFFSMMWVACGIGASAQTVLLKKLDRYTSNLTNEYSSINSNRRADLNKLAEKIVAEKMASGHVTVVFSSNDNSSLSQMSQAWMQLAIDKLSLRNIEVASCGTSESNISRETIYALKNAGFSIKTNPVSVSNKYTVNYSWSGSQMLMFSKKSDNFQIPTSNVVMVNVDDSIVTEENALNISRQTAVEMMYVAEKIMNSNLLSHQQ